MDAVTAKKFWFRKDIVKNDEDYTANPARDKEWSYYEESEDGHDDESNFAEMTLTDILEGNEDIGNVGLMPIIRRYMEEFNFSIEDLEFYNTMLEFLCKRARGEIKTGARFMRDIVLNHPLYEEDSIVNNKICLDLVKEATLLGVPSKWDNSLLGEMPEFMEEYLK
jgi:glutamate--cysteine ligase catalytic subunit